MTQVQGLLRKETHTNTIEQTKIVLCVSMKNDISYPPSTEHEASEVFTKCRRMAQKRLFSVE